MKNNLGYAQALFTIALENKKLIDFKQNGLQLLEILQQNPQLTKLFSSKQITKKEKKAILEKSFGTDIQLLFLTGLKLMVDHNKFYSLEKTLHELNSLINKQLNLQEGLIYSAQKLSETSINDIRTKLEKKFNCQIELKNKIDKKLIEGIKVIVNNQVIDNTILFQLDKLKAKIIEG